jgi:hypothetical protein
MQLRRLSSAALLIASIYASASSPALAADRCPKIESFDVFNVNGDKIREVGLNESFTLSWGKLRDANRFRNVKVEVSPGIGAVQAPGQRALSLGKVGDVKYKLKITGDGCEKREESKTVKVLPRETTGAPFPEGSKDSPEDRSDFLQWSTFGYFDDRPELSYYVLEIEFQNDKGQWKPLEQARVPQPPDESNPFTNTKKIPSDANAVRIRTWGVFNDNPDDRSPKTRWTYRYFAS